MYAFTKKAIIFQQINLELDCCDNRGGFEHFYKNIKSLEIINTPITKGLIEKLQIKTKDLHSIKNIGVE